MALVGLAFLEGAWAVARLSCAECIRRAVDVLGAPGAGRLGRRRQELAALIVRAVPPEWLYAGLAVSAALYAALFGLGAAAYRTLYLNSKFAGDP